MMSARLWLMLAVAIVIAGGIAGQAFAGHDSKPRANTQTLTAKQRAARAKLLATAGLLEKNGLNCGCRHHFPALKP
jgi:hypothetical protein